MYLRLLIWVRNGRIKNYIFLNFFWDLLPLYFAANRTYLQKLECICKETDGQIHKWIGKTPHSFSDTEIRIRYAKKNVSE